MSLVIALKHNGRFILGADTQVTSGWNKKAHNFTKVWEVPGYDYCCMGAVGSARGAQIISNIDGLLDAAGFGKDEISEQFVTLILPNVIYETLKKHGIECVDESDGGTKVMLPCEYLFAYKDRCWIIGQYMEVCEVDDYVAMGSGEEVAVGSIETAMKYKEKNPFKIISTAINIASEHTLYVDNNINYVFTYEEEDDQFKVIEIKDPEAANKFRKQLKDEKAKLKKELADQEAKRKAAEKKAKEKERARAEKKNGKVKLVETIVDNEKEAE